ncbi:PIG-L family deacetylase [Candidatus Woesearchaeota archaeon]|nr:PIG-L family deacetylase [Candidatus Woesearchaeota archaeon]
MVNTGVKESVLVLCAHSDDQILGCGGTIAKYAKEGKAVSIVIFSYGEMSHPWLKPYYIASLRKAESEMASTVIGAKDTIFLGLSEGKFKEEFEEKNMKEKLKELFKKYKPTKIYTHAVDDPLPDHSIVFSLVDQFCEETKYTGDLYSFEVWNPVNISKRDVPKVVVDISDTFKTKLKALKCFRSQRLAMLSLKWSIYWKAISNGRKNKVKYGEVFYKMR